MYRVDGLGEYRVIGATRDDAAGEAFDKFGKMMGLGFPGGVAVDRLAVGGNASAYVFPRGMMEEGNLDFSFSGLKSSAQRLIESIGREEKRERVSDLCASFQNAVVTTLIEKLDRAATKEQIKNLSVTGGVSANSLLREKAAALCSDRGYQLVIPPLKYCTDNAAMIGYVGAQRLRRGERDTQKMGPKPDGGIA